MNNKRRIDYIAWIRNIIERYADEFTARKRRSNVGKRFNIFIKRQPGEIVLKDQMLLGGLYRLHDQRIHTLNL